MISFVAFGTLFSSCWTLRSIFGMLLAKENTIDFFAFVCVYKCLLFICAVVFRPRRSCRPCTPFLLSHCFDLYRYRLMGAAHINALLLRKLSHIEELFPCRILLYSNTNPMFK